MTNETKIQAQIIFNAIKAMSAAYEQMHGEENDEIDSILYSVDCMMAPGGDFDDAEILETCFDCLQMATESFLN